MKKSEVVVKTDLASNWAKAVNYVPEKGTIIIYEYEDGSTPNIKIGDGQTLVNDLTFLINPPPCVNQDVLEF